MSNSISASASIREIGNMRTRDLVRGLLNKNLSTNEARATLAKLFEGVSLSDLPIVDTLLRHDQLFIHLEPFSEFPSEPSYHGHHELPIVPRDEVAPAYIAYRISQNESQLCEAFASLSAINRAIVSDHDSKIVDAIEAAIVSSGYSLALARKLAYIIGYWSKDLPSYQLAIDLVESFGINARNYGIMATVDSIGSEFNYLDLKYRFRTFVSLARNDSISQKIAHLCFSPVAYNLEHIHQLLVASYEISLTDAAIAFFAHREFKNDQSPAIPEKVEAAWDDLASSLGTNFENFVLTHGGSDTQAFRIAPAFIEDSRFRHFRRVIQPLYDFPSLRARAAFASGTDTAHFFENVDSVADLIPPKAFVHDPLPFKFHQNTAGELSRSCGIVWVAERYPDFSDTNADDMSLLMGSTMEVDRLLSTDMLRIAAGTAKDAFVKLLLHTLLRAHSSATRDSYKFKELFQAYIRQHHQGNILNFLETIHRLSPEVVRYFVALLDETMLSQMAFLMESSNSIYETRACILDWFGTITNDDTHRENARQLRLDRKIAAVRGAINETRLNIDAVRFRQWIEQTKLGEFSGFIRQNSPNLPSVEELVDKNRFQSMMLEAHRVPTTRALKAIMECYEEFCKNADFGIASFLGRRIRHGTLRGTLLTGLPDPLLTDLPPQAASQYQSWTADFSASINVLAGKMHFIDRASHKNGLISAEIDTTSKWQVCVVCLNAIFDESRKDHGSLAIPMLIEQYCWFIFEQELENVQAAISEARNQWGFLKMRYSSNDADVIAFEKSTNLALSAQFNTVISWFKKPPNVSAVAELGHVLDVVLQEARDEYSEFSPEIAFSGDPALKLTGATYSFVYDGLTIAVRNAAKHGRWTGSLEIEATVERVGESSVLHLTVTSEVRDGDCSDKALERMTLASQAGAQNADIVEGLSGMRKLVKMVAERRILKYRLAAIKGPPNDKVELSISLPYEGVVE